MVQPQIAIIDDGISEKFYSIEDLSNNLQISPELHIHVRVSYDPFLPSHGTTCAAIIKKYAHDAVLSSVKILNDNSHMGMKAQLITAINWCVENKINIVNLSLGTIDFKDFIEIETAIKNAYENGAIIIAACNNRNIFTCPASLKNVIGVRCDTSGKLKEGEYIYNPISPDGIEITACGSHKLLKYNGESKITSNCNSFATPFITALAYNIIKNNPNISFCELKEVLKTKAIRHSFINCRKIKSILRVNSCLNNSIDVPIIVVYNHGNRTYEFYEKITDRFRRNGYNAIAIVKESEEDLCNGRVPLKCYNNIRDSSFKVNIQGIFNIYDPDIIIVPIDMNKDSKAVYLKELESDLEVDIKIHIKNSEIEVLSSDESNETKTFTFSRDCQIDDLYNYILSLFA